jgi:hypothetical protein
MDNQIMLKAFQLSLWILLFSHPSTAQSAYSYKLGHGEVHKSMLTKTQAEILQWKIEKLKDEIGYVDFSMAYIDLAAQPATATATIDVDFAKQAESFARKSFQNNTNIGRNTKIIKHGMYLVYDQASQNAYMFCNTPADNYFENYQQQKMLSLFSQQLKEKNLFYALSNFIDKVKVQYQGGSKEMFYDEDYKIPGYLIPKNYGHADFSKKSNGVFPKNPGLLSISQSNDIEFIYHDIITLFKSTINKVGVTHIFFSPIMKPLMPRM